MDTGSRGGNKEKGSDAIELESTSLGMGLVTEF